MLNKNGVKDGIDCFRTKQGNIYYSLTARRKSEVEKPFLKELKKRNIWYMLSKTDIFIQRINMEEAAEISRQYF